MFLFGGFGFLHVAYCIAHHFAGIGVLPCLHLPSNEPSHPRWQRNVHLFDGHLDSSTILSLGYMNEHPGHSQILTVIWPRHRLYPSSSRASSFSATPDSCRTRAPVIRKCSLWAASSYPSPSVRIFEMQL